MAGFIGILIIVFGVFFVSLGMLFVNYELSPLKYLVKQEDVFHRPNFGLRIILPGLILFYLAFIILGK